ncbi:MAG: hypothetical protein RIT35_285 [Pseudomonadota bacterium]|jgi:hypothetical protein
MTAHNFKPDDLKAHLNTQMRVNLTQKQTFIC